MSCVTAFVVVFVHENDSFTSAAASVSNPVFNMRELYVIDERVDKVTMSERDG